MDGGTNTTQHPGLMRPVGLEPATSGNPKLTSTAPAPSVPGISSSSTGGNWMMPVGVRAPIGASHAGPPTLLPATGTAPLTTHMSAPATPATHANLMGQPHLSPAVLATPTTTSQILLQALQPSQFAHTAGPATVSALPHAAFGTAPGGMFRSSATVSPFSGPAISSTTASSAGLSAGHTLVQQYGIAPSAPGAAQTSLFSSMQPRPQPQNLINLQAQAAHAALAAYSAAGGASSLANVRLASAPAAPLATKAKVLLSYGGRSSVNSAGVWEYLGGETRLVGGLDPTGGFAALAARVEQESQMKLGVEGCLSYELPGCPGTLVDVRCDGDAEAMWSEWADFCSLSKQFSFKLHLYVVPFSSTSQHSSGSGGRGSDALSAVLYANPHRARGSMEGAHSSGGDPVSDTPSREDMCPASASASEAAAVAHAPPRSPATSPASAPASSSSPSSSAGLYATQHGQLLAQQLQLDGLAKIQASHALQLAALQPDQEDAAAAAADGGNNSGGDDDDDAATCGASSDRQEGRANGSSVPSAGWMDTGEAHGKAGGNSSRYQAGCTSFDRLLTRVKNSVEIIRPADLRIIRFMGSGGFADCYLAKWLGVEVAVKCLRDLPGAHTSSKASVKELLNEASILSGMRHPNVLCLYAVALPDELAAQYGIRPAPTAHPASQPHDTLDAAHHLGPSPLATVLEDHDEEAAGARGDEHNMLELAHSDPGSRPARADSLTMSRVAAGLKPLSLSTLPEQELFGTPCVGDVSSPLSAGTGSDRQGSSTRTAGSRRITPPTSPFAEAATISTPFQTTHLQSGGAKDLTPTGSAGSMDEHLHVGSNTRATATGVQRGAAASAAELSYPESPATPLTAAALQLPELKSDTIAPEPSFGTITNSISFGLTSARTDSGVGGDASAASPHKAISAAAGLTRELEEGLAQHPSWPGAAAAAGAAESGGASSYKYNTDEDEAIRKAVQAAEAAAAASADVESQTAVSEGLITRPALVAEFLSGCSLGSAITRKADFLASNLVLAKVAMDASRGMEYCHAKHVTHWNLKTGNLIVGFTSAKVPICKVADMGLSKPRQLCELDDAGVARVLPWAAPELVRAPDTATEKVDVYSFGMILWSMWAKRHPFDRQDIARVFLRTMQGHAVRPPLPGSPEWCMVYLDEPSPPEPVPGWSDLLQRCWAQDPTSRPAFTDVSHTLIGMFSAAKAAKRAARAGASKAQPNGGGGGAEGVGTSPD